MSLLLLPLDARPVCHTFPQQLAAMASVHLRVPPPTLLGVLKQPADHPALLDWIAEQATGCQTAIVSTDLLIYGGLIASRVNAECVTTLVQRWQQARTFLQSRLPEAAELLAFSSILRIPRYNNAEEEPAYWAQYGTGLYALSEQLHQAGYPNAMAPDDLQQVLAHCKVPAAIVQDFLERRQRLNAVNEALLNDWENGQLGTLVFGQDDTGPCGLNVQEADALKHCIAAQQATAGPVTAWVQTGADELAHTLLARAVLDTVPKPCPKPKVWVSYSHPEGAEAYARFDGLPIGEVVAQRLQATGALPTDNATQADWWLLVHTPATVTGQGDHCAEATATVDAALQYTTLVHQMRLAQQQNKAVALADVAFANGADPDLLALLLKHWPQGPPPCWVAYGGWNTPGNAVGSAVAAGMLHWLACQTGRLNPQAARQVLLTRLLDDWAYQAVERYAVRQALAAGDPTALTPHAITQRLAPWANRLQKWLGLPPTPVPCHFPCHRPFEVAFDVSFALDSPSA